jgi:hypothetical protein
MEDLYTVSFGLAAAGTVTGSAYDVSRNEFVEVFVRTGTAIGGSAVTSTVYVDVADQDGNWYNAVGTIASVGTSSTGLLGMRRGATGAGAALPGVLGVSQRIRTVTAGGTAELGVNVVGY